jgi:hypothetical protein
LGKATLLTPLYISVAWVLITTYQFFTQTTVATVTAQIQTYMPTIGTYLATKLDIITFIHSFAWIFLLSSVIPSLLLGKERGVLAQFGVCLTLSFLAFAIQDILIGFSGTLDQILGLAPLFQNPALAIAYLSVPYLLMMGFDIRSKRKKQEWLSLEEKTNDSPEETPITEEDFFEEEEKTQEDEYAYAA